MSPAAAAILQSLSLQMDRGTITGRAALEGRTVQIADVTADPHYALAQSRETEPFWSGCAIAAARAFKFGFPEDLTRL